MEQYLNKTVTLTVFKNGRELFFKAKILDVTSTHITFEDKFMEKYTFKKKYIEEISPIS